MIEGHGDDTFRYGSKIRHNFSTNICSDVDHAGLMAHLSTLGEKLSSYPPPVPASVENLLAEEAGIGADCVMVTNGATEAIYLIAHHLQGRHSAIISPTFREYQDACKLYRHQISFISELSDIPAEAQAVWLCNPNNPTGHVTEKTQLLKTIDGHRDHIFIIDQAYCDYTSRPVLSAREAVERPNVILLHSLTKRFAIPALRIGYAVGNPRLLSSVKELRMPWAVNLFAIEGAEYLLRNGSGYCIDHRQLHAEACRIASRLSESGINVLPTDCNFILCHLPHGKASELKNFLIDRHGLLIRDASNFQGLSEAHFRIAAQSRDENDLLISAIKQWMSLS